MSRHRHRRPGLLRVSGRLQTRAQAKFRGAPWPEVDRRRNSPRPVYVMRLDGGEV